MKGVEHGDGVLELIIDRVLVAVERIQGRVLDAGAVGLVALPQPVRVSGAGAAGHQVQEPGTGSSLAVTGKIYHPGQFLRPAPTVGDGLGRDVMPHVLIDPQCVDAAEPGLIVGHLLQQRFDGSPRRAPRRAELARQPQDGGVLTAQLPDRPPARPSAQQGPRPGDGVAGSVSTPPGQSGSAQRQVRLRQVSSTGRPKHGVSISRTSRRPWLRITTPQTRQPWTRADDCTLTRRKGPRRPVTSSTKVTCSPSNPTSRSQREQENSAEQAPVDALGSVTGRGFGSRAWSLSILRRPRPPAPQVTPASRSHPPQV